MRDFDFDELLDEVLREEARVEPRVGMERRILAEVRADTRNGLRVWGVPVGAVAGLVLGGVLIMQHWDGRRDFGGARDAGRDLAVANKVMGAPAQGEAKRDGGGLGMDFGSAPPLLSRERWAVRSGRTEGNERERLPKMETFPAVAQSGGFLPEPDGDGTKVRDAVNSPEVAQALLELKAEQEKPIEVAAIEISPL